MNDTAIQGHDSGLTRKQVVPGSRDAEVMAQNPLLRCPKIRALLQIEDGHAGKAREAWEAWEIQLHLWDCQL